MGYIDMTDAQLVAHNWAALLESSGGFEKSSHQAGFLRKSFLAKYTKADLTHIFGGLASDSREALVNRAAGTIEKILA